MKIISLYRKRCVILYKNCTMKTSSDIRSMLLGQSPCRVTPDRITTLSEGQIFVFGSNAAGMHGGGAAYTAMQRFGAILGQGDGLQGQSYAISTMEGMEPMRQNILRFIGFARQHPELTFLVTSIGCGIAGYKVRDVAPLFAPAVELKNVWLPKDFWEVLSSMDN